MNGYSDREILARTLMAEAGNQGPVGMLAAGSVILNRAKSGGYGQGIQGVIMKPGQFSPWNSVTGYAGGEQGQDMAAIRPTKMAYDIADQLLSGQYEDPTGGATHFYNPDFANPKWGARSGGQWMRIGEHLFGQADAGRGSATPMASTQGSPTMTMTPDPQPRGGLFSRLFPGMQEDTAVSVETDPFANLSRSQRTMLGFAALRDAAAALQGQEGGYFQKALGGFEEAKERERLRRQGIQTNLVNTVTALTQIQQANAEAARLARVGIGSGPNEASIRLEQMLSEKVAEAMGGQPAVAAPVVTAAPAVTAPVVTAAPAAPAVTAPGVSPVVTPSVEVPVLPATGAPAVTPDVTPAAPPAAPALLRPQNIQEAIQLSYNEDIPVADRARMISEFQSLAPEELRSLSPIVEDLMKRAEKEREAQAAEVATVEKEAETESKTLPLLADALSFLEQGESANVLGARAGQFANRLGIPIESYNRASSAVKQLGSIAAMSSVAEAKRSGFTGSLTDKDIELIQRQGGIYDMEGDPYATLRTLRALRDQLSPEGQKALGLMISERQAPAAAGTGIEDALRRAQGGYK